MSQDINIQKLSYLTCQTHKKRVQFICTVEKCQKSLICGDCLVLDKFHVGEHLDGFCSTDDYKTKIIFGIFQKFEESATKLANQETIIRNNVVEIAENFGQQVNALQAKVFALLADHFKSLKDRIRGLVEQKFENYLKSMRELSEEIRATRENSHEFLEGLKGYLNQENMSMPDIENQIRLFNNKKYFDRALIGRIDTLLNYLAEQAKITPNLEVTKTVFKLDDARFQAIGQELVGVVKGALKKGLESHELIDDLQAKPVYQISRIRDDFLSLNDNSEFQRVAKLNRVNLFEMSPHSSIKLNCMLVVDEKFLVTCFNERQYKVWWINPAKFNSGLRNAIKLENPFVLISESDPEWHRNFVTAAEYLHLNDNHYRIVTGDKDGCLQVTEYEFLNDKVTSRSPIKNFRAAEHKVTELKYLPNCELLAVGDSRFVVSFYNAKNWSLKTLVEAPEPSKMIACAFVNLSTYLCGMSDRGTLFSWRMEYADSAVTAQTRNNTMFEGNALELRRCSNHLKLVFEKGPYNSKLFNLFSTNHKGDNLVFASDGASFRVISMYNGETVAVIDGAHYKGISSLFFVVNTSTESQIYRLLNIIENDYLHKTPAEIQESHDQLQTHYRDLLNCYKMITVSNKEFIRLWAIQGLEPRLLDQDQHPGGAAGKFLFKYQNRKGENFLMTSGRNSNKIIIYQIN